jgi:hypothetical protein
VDTLAQRAEAAVQNCLSNLPEAFEVAKQKNFKLLESANNPGGSTNQTGTSGPNSKFLFSH